MSRATEASPRRDGDLPRHFPGRRPGCNSPALGMSNLIRRFLTQLILLNFRMHEHCLGSVRKGTIQAFDGSTSFSVDSRWLLARRLTNAAENNRHTAHAT